MLPYVSLSAVPAGGGGPPVHSSDIFCMDLHCPGLRGKKQRLLGVMLASKSMDST